MSNYFWDLVRYIEQMQTGHWAVVLAVAVLLGALCLRGMGSRSGY